ncbi:hypothetical protein ACOMHN_009824 [Nucella lapillus]
MVHPPVDKRLWSLRQGAGGGGIGGGGGGSQLLHSGWTSFNSDVSNLTSGSNQSASSVEWLLQERQQDSEQILINLGFAGAALSSAPDTMYTRIPDRFLHSEPAHGSSEDDAIAAEGSPAEATPPSGRGAMSRGQYLQKLFGKACLSRDYRRYILTKVPDYYFIYPQYAPNSLPPPPPPPPPSSSRQRADPSEEDPSSVQDPAGSSASAVAAASSQDGDYHSSEMPPRTCLSSEAKQRSRSSFETGQTSSRCDRDLASPSSSIKAAKWLTNSCDGGGDDDSRPVNCCDVSFRHAADNPAHCAENVVSNPEAGEVLESSRESLPNRTGNISGCLLDESVNSAGFDSGNEVEASDPCSPVSKKGQFNADSTHVNSSADTETHCVDVIDDTQPTDSSVMVQSTDDVDNISSSSDSAGYGDEVGEPNDVAQVSNSTMTS